MSSFAVQGDLESDNAAPSYMHSDRTPGIFRLKRVSRMAGHPAKLRSLASLCQVKGVLCVAPDRPFPDVKQNATTEPKGNTTLLGSFPCSNGQTLFLPPTPLGDSIGQGRFGRTVLEASLHLKVELHQQRGETRLDPGRHPHAAACFPSFCTGSPVEPRVRPPSQPCVLDLPAHAPILRGFRTAL